MELVHPSASGDFTMQVDRIIADGTLERSLLIVTRPNTPATAFAHILTDVLRRTAQAFQGDSSPFTDAIGHGR